jgi:flagellar motor protein MotB
MMSTLDAEKFKQLVSNLQGNPYIFDKIDNAANIGQTGLEQAPYVPEGDYTDPSDSWEILAGEIGDGIRDGLGEDSNIEIDVTFTDAQIVISIGGDILFNTLSDVLLPAGYEALYAIMDVVLEVWETNIISEIEIGGHADIQVIPPGSAFSDNDELSSARALRVLRYVVSNFDFPRNKITFKGYGEWHPRDGIRGDETGRYDFEQFQRNRRVEFTLYRNFAVDEDTGQAYERGV